MAHSKINSEKMTEAADNEDKRLIIRPDYLSNYNSLIQAPYIMAWIGRLLVISAEQDFSLTDDSDNVKFQYIKYPDSFRACVVQVSQGIRQAFNTAHHNMDCIRMKSENIVENVEKGIEVLQESKNNKKINQNEWPIVERYLRDTEKECEECIETAASITEEFRKIAKTMDELVEALIRSEGKNKNEQNATNLEMEKTREKRETETKRKNEHEEICEKNLEKIEDANPHSKKKDSSSIFSNVGKVFRWVGQKIIPVSVSTSETVEPSITPEITNEEANKSGQNPPASTSETVEPILTTPNTTTEEANSCLAANNILNHAKMLMCPSCGKKEHANLRTSLEKMLSDLNLDASQSVVSAFKELCEDGIEICNEINKEIDQAKNRSAATDARVEKFFERAKDFYNNYHDKPIMEHLARPKSTDENKSGEKWNKVPTNETVEPSTPLEITNEEANAYLDANDIFNHAEKLMSTSCEKEDITKVKTSLEKMLSDLNVDAPQSVVSAVKELCEDGIEICNEIHKEIDQAKNRSTATDALVEKFFEKAKDFYNKAKHVLQNIEPPKLADDKIYQKPGGRFTEGILQTPKRNEREAEVRDTLDRSIENVKLLIEHWENFQDTFNKMHHLTKEKKKKDVALTDKKQDKTSQNRIHQLVLEQSKEAQKLAHVVGVLSSLYCCISENYLQDGVKLLQRFISLDLVKDRDKIVDIGRELQNVQERAKNEILAIAQEKREDLSKKINNL